jgi:hypothetical protein
MSLVFIDVGVGLLLISIGLIVHLGKQYDLIAGYNTMDEQKKRRFDIIKYARLFGVTFYIMGTLLVLFALLFAFMNIDKGYMVGVMLVVIFGGVIYLNVMGEIIKRNAKKRP